MSTPTLTTPLGRLRLTSLLEGVSYLVLLGIAMPLKYFAGIPLAVRFAGMTHGFLFIVLLLAIFQAWGSRHVTTRIAAHTFIASLIPFGAFWMDLRLRNLPDSPAPDGSAD